MSTFLSRPLHSAQPVERNAVPAWVGANRDMPGKSFNTPERQHTGVDSCCREAPCLTAAASEPGPGVLIGQHPC